jgi:hypothetical protein
MTDKTSKLSDEAKIKILGMSGKELFQHLQTRHDLKPKEKMEINKFWLDQNNVKIER